MGIEEVSRIPVCFWYHFLMPFWHRTVVVTWHFSSRLPLFSCADGLARAVSPTTPGARRTTRRVAFLSLSPLPSSFLSPLRLLLSPFFLFASFS